MFLFVVSDMVVAVADMSGGGGALATVWGFQYSFGVVAGVGCES